MKAVVVTGAARGLGKAITTVLLGEGYHLIAIDIDMTNLIELKQEMIRNFSISDQRLGLIEFDLRNIHQMDSLISSIKNCMNSSNFLWGYVNNAAIYFPSTKESSRLSDIRLNGMMEILEVNMISAFLLSREMFKWMKETRKGGSIVFISSFVNSRGSLINPVYAMTKAAIVNLAKSIASEGGEDNIRCNAISPGVMETQMSSEIYKSEEILRKRIERNLIKRTCTTEEVAHLVKYLLSDYSGYITGENLNISGGMLIK